MKKVKRIGPKRPITKQSSLKGRAIRANQGSENIGQHDAQGPMGTRIARKNRRNKLGLTEGAPEKVVQDVINRRQYGDVVTRDASQADIKDNSERTALIESYEIPPTPRKKWYKPWTWMSGGNKTNKKKRKTHKRKTHKRKKTRKRKTHKREKTRKRNKLYAGLKRGAEDSFEVCTKYRKCPDGIPPACEKPYKEPCRRRVRFQ